MNVSPLDAPLRVTFFSDYSAQSKIEEVYTARSLASRINLVTAARKADLPWLKLARFGDIKTEKASLRHDANVLGITGIEADYDAEEMTFDAACERLQSQGIAAIVYTSPSHTEDRHRWRVLCPLSIEVPAANREHLVGRLNGLFGGIFAGESFTVSQSFYFGSVNHNPSHRVELIEGTPIDQHDDLDEIWRGKPNTKPAGPGEPTSKGRLDAAALITAVMDGTNYHQAIVRLAGHFAARRTPFMEAKAALVDAMEAVFPPDRDARWKARFNDIDRVLLDIFGKEAVKLDAEPRADNEGPEPEAEQGRSSDRVDDGKPSAGPSPSSFNVIDPVTLLRRPIPERQWIVPDWMPAGAVTADFGDGGTGKTLLAQQLMTSCATMNPWCGLAVMPCRSLGLFCEDDEDELHRRQEQINRAMGVNFGDLGNMRWVSGVGADNALVSFAGEGRMIRMPRFEAIRDAALSFQARLVVLDTAADLFAGNENDRHQVRQFISLLSGLAVEIKGAVLLNAHPSRAGISTGNLDGGSTAWNNSVRSRWSLARPASDGDAQPDTNERILTRRKANYTTIGDTIALRWASGILAPVTQAGGVFGSINRQAAEGVFLTLLDGCWAQGVFVSHSRSAGNFAPKVFAKRPDRDGYSRADFDGAMSRLFAANQIRVEDYRRTNRIGAQRIARQGMANTPKQDSENGL